MTLPSQSDALAAIVPNNPLTGAAHFTPGPEAQKLQQQARAEGCSTGIAVCVACGTRWCAGLEPGAPPTRLQCPECQEFYSMFLPDV